MFQSKLLKVTLVYPWMLLYTHTLFEQINLNARDWFSSYIIIGTDTGVLSSLLGEGKRPLWQEKILNIVDFLKKGDGLHWRCLKIDGKLPQILPGLMPALNLMHIKSVTLQDQLGQPTIGNQMKKKLEITPWSSNLYSTRTTLSEILDSLKQRLSPHFDLR